MGLKFGMRFETRVCECGGTRLVGQPCAECGRSAAKHEVDPEVQRRRRTADQLIGVLDTAVNDGVPSRIEDFTEVAASTISGLLVAIKNLANSDAELGTAQNVCSDVRRVSEWSNWKAPRPYRAIWGELSDAGPELLKSARLWLEVLGSSTMLEGQRRSEEAQQCLDRVIDAAVRADEQLAELNLVLGGDPEGVLRLATAIVLRRYAREDRGDVSLAGVDAFGRERLQRVVGADAQIEDGLGIALLWMAAVGEVFLDQDRLDSVARSAYESLVRSGGLRALVAHDDWQSGQLKAMQSVRRITSVLGNMAGSAGDPESAARSSLLAVQDLVHEPMRHLLATVLGAQKRQTYSTFAVRDGADMLKQYGQVVDSEAVGLAERLRNASAHSDYLVEGNSVVLSPHKAPQRLTWAELDDGVLETLETVIALSMGVVCAMSIEGLASGGSGTFEDAGVSIADALAAMLMMGGWTDVEVTLSDRTCDVEALGDVSSALSLAAAIGVGLPSGIEVLNIELADGGVSRKLVVPTERMRERKAASIVDSELATAEYMSHVELDGEPYMTQVAFRRYLASRVETVVSEEYQVFVRDVRRYREAALRVGDVHLAGLIKSVLEARRCQEIGIAISAQVSQDLDALVKICRTHVANNFVV